ncbi:unnamed protein product, partial [Symbiodinium sp. KB8]
DATAASARARFEERRRQWAKMRRDGRLDMESSVTEQAVLEKRQQKKQKDANDRTKVELRRLRAEGKQQDLVELLPTLAGDPWQYGVECLLSMGALESVAAIVRDDRMRSFKRGTAFPILRLACLLAVVLAKHVEKDTVAATAKEAEVAHPEKAVPEAESPKSEELGAEAELGGEEEVEEEEATSVDVTGAVFLLGGVTFVMSLFYLVNHDDIDIRMHTWKVINATVSIFVAVLLFQGLAGVSDMICDRVIESHVKREFTKISIAYMTFAIFYCSLHLILYNIAHMTDETSSKKSQEATFWSRAKPVEASFEDLQKRKMACWATLFSHMSGFAIIRCSLDLQQLQSFKVGVAVVVPTVVNALLLLLLFKITDAMRARVASEDPRYQLWEHASEEAEDDVAAIGISFSAVVVLRFLLTGIMSNAEGLELPVLNHPHGAKIGIGVAALVCAITSISILMIHAKIQERNHRAHALVASQSTPAEYRQSYMTRWILISSSAFATGASWCALYMVKWILFGFEEAADAEANPNSCIWRVVLALTVSFGSFVLVYFLDWLQDLDSTDESADRAIGEVINAIGVCVGFAWEQAFDAGVNTIGSLTEHLGQYYPIWARLFVAAAVAMVMIPAWRLYLIKKSLEKHQKCTKCGAVLLIDASFCHVCGAKKPQASAP